VVLRGAESTRFNANDRTEEMKTKRIALALAAAMTFAAGAAQKLQRPMADDNADRHSL
jgi:hypothetical protein